MIKKIHEYFLGRMQNSLLLILLLLSHLLTLSISRFRTQPLLMHPLESVLRFLLLLLSQSISRLLVFSLPILRSMSISISASGNFPTTFLLSHALTESYELSQSFLEQISKAETYELWELISLSKELSGSLSESNQASQELLRFLMQGFCSLEDSCDRPKDPLNFATKLPLAAYWLKEEQRADLIEIRAFWYEEHSLNFWTHFSVGLKTQQYLIYDHFWFWLRQKVIDRFQSMQKERLPRINHLD